MTDVQNRGKSQSDKNVIIVTGSSGSIGSAIVKALADHYRVLGFDRDSAPHPLSEAECICIDLSDRDKMDAAFDRVRTAHGRRISSVVHLAAYFDLTGESNPAYDAVNLGGTRNLLHSLKNFEVEQFFFFSTMLVHAPTKIAIDH
jgi:nucleoside-diphosphate-sugar epimerase